MNDTTASDDAPRAFVRALLSGEAPMPASARALGCKPLDADPERGWVRLSWQGTPEFTNPEGMVQGGILAAMLDDTLSLAIIVTLGAGHFVPTLEMKLSFLEPAYPGELIAEAEVLRRGRRVAFVEGTIRRPDGTLCCKASATQMVRTLRQV